MPDRVRNGNFQPNGRNAAGWAESYDLTWSQSPRVVTSAAGIQPNGMLLVQAAFAVAGMAARPY
jgi:hypothetical protein